MIYFDLNIILSTTHAIAVGGTAIIFIMTMIMVTHRNISIEIDMI
jgi:hypothetical protein